MVNQYCAHFFARNWQLPFLNRWKGENDSRKYFMINLCERMLLTRWGSNPQSPDLQWDAQTIEPPRLTCRSWSEGQLKSVSCINTMLCDYESVWPEVWSQSKCHNDLYFMVQWFCLISWRVFDVLTSFFWIMKSVWLEVWPQNKCRWQWATFRSSVILPYILESIWCINIKLVCYELVWPEVWPKIKCRSLSHIFHRPLILPYI